MGTSGPTLPFVVGALTFRSGRKPKDSSEIRNLLEAVASTKVPGHYIYVYWCPTIGAPVFSLRDAPRPEWARWSGEAVSEYAPLEFGSDIRSKAGFDCVDPSECIRKLADDAWEWVERGDFSRNPGLSGLYEYGPFTPHDIQFIESTLEQSDVRASG